MEKLDNKKWVKVCEDKFRANFSGIAEDICKKRGLRIVRLFGPTCSGKTTAAEILISLFAELGKKAHVISIDDFFYDREELFALSKAKGIEGLDYDSPDTIDCDALRAFADEIFECDEVHCPVFDFKEGRKTGYRSMKIDENDIFIFEGIQANYPNVISMLSEYGSASIYIAPQSNVCAGGEDFVPNELRLMRRVVRDYLFRHADADFTFMLWESVRSNEEKNIFPYVNNTDYTVDSSMAYEIGVLKPYLENIAQTMDKNGKYYPKAMEILRRIARVDVISRDAIEDGMLYCEFV